MNPSGTSSPKHPSTPLRYIRHFEYGVVFTLILLMIALIAVSTAELALDLWQQWLAPPRFLLDLSNLQTFLGFFMMVLISLELLETIKNYLTEHYLHVEIVLLVAMIAVARKVIILDIHHINPHTLFGIAALVVGLAAGYWLIKQATHHSPKNTPPPS